MGIFMHSCVDHGFFQKATVQAFRVFNTCIHVAISRHAISLFHLKCSKYQPRHSTSAMFPLSRSKDVHKKHHSRELSKESSCLMLPSPSGASADPGRFSAFTRNRAEPPKYSCKCEGIEENTVSPRTMSHCE